MKIGVIGSNGFVGKRIVERLSAIGITRENYDSMKGEQFDVLVNANGNSRKFWAESHPIEDFEANAVWTYRYTQDFKFDSFIQVSSLDVFTQGNYSFSKRIAEEIVRRQRNYFILRCPAIVGTDMKKGLLYDVMNNKKVFLTPDSRLQFVTDTEIAEIINIFTQLRGTVSYNVCGFGSVSVDEIAGLVGKELDYAEELNHQHYDFDCTINNVYPMKSSLDYVKETVL